MKTLYFIYIFLALPFFINAQSIEEETIQYSYDNLNRLIHVIWEDDIEKMYVYDDVGNRIQLEITETGLGIDDEILRNTITVYPNPTKNLITIKLPESEVFFNPEITLYDLQGKLLHSEKKNIGTNREIQLSLSSFSNGVYLIRLMENEKFWSQLIIKK
jgi:hypothetical protein